MARTSSGVSGDDAEDAMWWLAGTRCLKGSSALALRGLAQGKKEKERERENRIDPLKMTLCDCEERIDNYWGQDWEKGERWIERKSNQHRLEWEFEARRVRRRMSSDLVPSLRLAMHDQHRRR